MIRSACCGMLHFSIYFCRNSKKRKTTEKSYTIKKLFNWKIKYRSCNCGRRVPAVKVSQMLRRSAVTR